MRATPHVAQFGATGYRGSAIDRRTTRHAGYAVSQQKRKLIEQGSRGGRSRVCLGRQRTRLVRARRLILPRPGRKTRERRAFERQRWFRRGQRWRVGCEGRISVIKRRHGLRRCRYRGADGMSRWIGLGVIANNLVSTATVLRHRAARVIKTVN